MTQEEWRTIHNALAIMQCGYRQASDRERIQRLMDKVRDKHIAIPVAYSGEHGIDPKNDPNRWSDE